MKIPNSESPHFPIPHQRSVKGSSILSALGSGFPGLRAGVTLVVTFYCEHLLLESSRGAGRVLPCWPEDVHRSGKKVQTAVWRWLPSGWNYRCGSLYALEHHRSRLGEIHIRAATFARKIASYEVDIDPATVETNIVRFRLRGVPAGQFVEEAHRLGVHMLPSGPNAVHAVFYLDITDSDVDRASELARRSLALSGTATGRNPFSQ